MKEGRPTGRRTSESWEASLRQARAQFPAVDRACVDITPLLADDAMLGRLLLDLGRVGFTPVRRGSRPVPPLNEVVSRLRAMFRTQDVDYTVEPFGVAFRALAGQRSLSHVARMTALSRSVVDRLITGKVPPTAAEMETVALAFVKAPWYFREYRTMLICSALSHHLDENPDRSAVVFRRLVQPERLQSLTDPVSATG